MEKELKIDAVYVMLTNACNLRCRYCFIEDSFRVGVMDEDVLGQMVRFFNGVFKPKQWSFQGGEVLLYQELLLKGMKLIKDVDEKAYITITTNGTMSFDEDLLTFIKGNNIGVRVSMDNFVLQNDKVRGKSAKVFNFILDAVERSLNLQMCITLVPDNVVGISNWVKFLAGIGVEWFVVFPVVEADWESESIKDYKRELGLLKKIYSLYDVNKIVEGQDAFCGRYCRQIAVNYKGELYPCHMAYFKAKEIAKFLGREPVIGNVWDGIDIEAIEAFNKFELANIEKCKMCDMYNKCKMCWVADLLKHGECPSKIACELNKV